MVADRRENLWNLRHLRINSPHLDFRGLGNWQVSRKWSSVSIPMEDARQMREWEAEFEAAARRPLKERFRYSFIRTHRPVLDDAKYRSFDSTAEYREWCAKNLPDWLGYGPAV